MKIKRIADITKGKLLSGGGSSEIELADISTDSRTIRKGQLFIALKGPNFDGNKFIALAFKAGAAGAIVSDTAYLPPDSRKIIIKVNDTLQAFQDLAAYNRRQFNIPLVAVTGSNGKTTVKEMLWTVLSSRYNVLKNEGTENNHIGVPATLLKLNKDHRMCVVEIGANHKGEIAGLAAIAKPDAAVITNVGPSHLEFFGNLYGVYEAKTEILDHLGRHGVLAINGDDEYLSKISKKNLRILKYGFKPANDFRAQAVEAGKKRLAFVVNGKMVFGLNLCGVHNIYNAMAAISIAGNFGIDYRSMRETLAGYNPAKMRLDIRNIDGIDIINDSYNSNPLSMSSALDAVKNYPARARWVVSADMLELGKESVRFHKMIGEKIAHSKIDGLLTFGDLSRHTLTQATASGMRKDRLWHCQAHDEIAIILKRIAKNGDAVLLKGSRSMKMEKVLEKFESLKHKR